MKVVLTVGIAAGVFLLAALISIQAEEIAKLRFGECSVGWLVPLRDGATWRDVEIAEKEKGNRHFEEVRIELKGSVSVPLNQPVMVVYSGLWAKRQQQQVDLSFLKTFEPDSLVALTLSLSALDRGVIRDLPKHRELRAIHLGPLSRFDNETLQPLKEKPWLENLTLAEGKIDDRGLKHLGGLVALEQLNLFNTQVTDTGLPYLGRMVRLRSIDLGLTRVSGSGLKHLAKSRELEELKLRKTRFGDQHVALLKEFPKLSSLYLQETNITDAGVNQLAEIQTLRVLDLSSTDVTDEGLTSLTALKDLAQLFVSGTNATKEGVATLNRSLPSLEVISDVKVER